MNATRYFLLSQNMSQQRKSKDMPLPFVPDCTGSRGLLDDISMHTSRSHYVVYLYVSLRAWSLSVC